MTHRLNRVKAIDRASDQCFVFANQIKSERQSLNKLKAASCHTDSKRLGNSIKRHNIEWFALEIVSFEE